MLKNLLKKLKRDHLVRDSVYMVISNIYSKGMAYLFYFITAIILGTEGFGILRGLLPLMDTVIILFCSGIPPSMARYISQYSEKDYSWIFSILLVMVVLSTLGALFIFLLRYILSGGYEDIGTTLYLVVGFTVISSSFISWGRGVLQGLLKIKDLSKTWIVEYLFKIPLAVVFSLYLGVLGTILSISLSYILGGFFGFHLLRRYIEIEKLDIVNTLREKRDLIKEVIFYSIPIALGTASYRLLNDLDSVVIMSLLGAQDNGIYGYASLLSRGVFLFASAVGIPLLPRIAKTRDFNSIKKALLINLTLITPVLLIMFLFPEEILRIFFGVEDERAVISLKVLSISAGFMSSYTVCASALQGLGYGKIPLYILLIGITLNGILNYLFVKKIGIVGGAYGTLISSILIFTLIIMYLKRVYKKCGGGDLNP
ncbi:flippase [Methanothermococcus sp. SCGC AD-155-N22]|nr:flippase [Methanothermococcus sp. SCGC AD-155-N22]